MICDRERGREFSGSGTGGRGGESQPRSSQHQIM
ncbi:hypothetical protein TIFTF001_000232, partial [Ficus carica]